MTDNAQEFGDEENTDFETVFVLADFDSPEYSYLYKRDNRIVGPPVVLHCAAKEEVSQHLFEENNWYFCSSHCVGRTIGP